ncbi:MAG: NADH-ubiquinone oxidoreductase chain J, partial [uncultured Blastococcus sp.]
ERDPERRRDRRLLGAGADRAGRRAGHGVQPQRRPLRPLAGQHHAGARRLLRRPGGAVPGRGPDHRLHRRHHDPLPLRADAGRPRLLRLRRGDPAGAADRRRGARDRVRRARRRRHRRGHPRPAEHRPGRRAGRAGQHPGDRRAAVHRLPAGLRGHQCAADHRRGRRHGPRAHRTRPGQPLDAAGTVPGALPHRPAADAARPRCVRARQLRRGRRAAARRPDRRGQPGHRHRAAGARPDAAPHRSRAARPARRRARHARGFAQRRPRGTDGRGPPM